METTGEHPVVDQDDPDSDPALFDDLTDDDDLGDDPLAVPAFRKAGAATSAKRGRLVTVTAKAGGVGKTSSTAHLAERAAQKGMRVVAVDDRSQGDLRKRLGFDDSRTLLQVALEWDGTAATIGDWILHDPHLAADWIVGPDSGREDYDDSLIPDEMYGHLIDVLLGMYDVVFVDTTPARVDRAREQFFTTWAPRLAEDGRSAAVVVSEWDRAKLNNAREWSVTITNLGVDRSRVFFLPNHRFDPSAETSDALPLDDVLRRFTSVRILDPLPFSQRVIDGNNGFGPPVAGLDEPAYRQSIDAALRAILADARFDPEPVQKRRLFGRKGRR